MSAWQSSSAFRHGRKGDFVSHGILFEVGGRNKKGKSADDVIRDDLEYPAPRKIPLWTLGMR